MALAVVFGAMLGGCLHDRLVREFRRGDAALLTSPALHVILCGTNMGRVDARRAGACVAVIAGGFFFLVDVGPGAWRVVDLAGLPTDRLTGVFLTKFLTDTVGDLDEAVTRSWVGGRSQRLLVYGPPGTARLVHDVDDMVAMDAAIRRAHHDPHLLPADALGADAREFALPGPPDAAVVFDRNGLCVTAFSVGPEGEPPSVGYRFDYRGRAVVIAGNARAHPNVVRYAAGADLLVHEALDAKMIGYGLRAMEDAGQHRTALLTRDLLAHRASAVEAATAAREAGVGELVLTRVVPPPDGLLVPWVLLRSARRVFPNVVLGEDGMRFRLDPR